MERIRSTMASALKKKAPKSHHQPAHQRPASHPILCLQRTLGNRAVQRILRYWTIYSKGEPNQIRDIYEPGSERVEEKSIAKSKPARVLAGTHVSSVESLAASHGDSLAYVPSAVDAPKEYPASASTKAAFDPGAVVGGQTASQLDQILSNSQFLKPYIQDKLKQKSIAAAGKFIIHASDAEFDMAYMTLHHKLDQLNNPAFRKELELKKGFYWPPEDAIHLRPLANMSQALHEAIHKFSEMGFVRMFGKFINEGTTQYFADRVQVELGLPPAESHGYDRELVFATQLIPYLGESFTAEQYFKDFDAISMLSKLGLTLAEYNKKYRFGEDAKVRFLRYLKRLI